MTGGPIPEMRQLFDVELEPIAGSRFQPTGFPDIGAALFERPVRANGELRWVNSLIVESAQSMANRLEEVGWDRSLQAPVPTLEGLPYVRVIAADDDRYLTSSRTEAHRLASAFVKHSTLGGTPMKEEIRDRLCLKDDTPLAPRDIAAAVFALDPLSLVHGVFFADTEWPGQPKVARAVTGFVEANDARPAISGGVKRDEVRHRLEREGAGIAEGYGFVPFHRIEYTAGTITAFFSIDRGQIAAYGLGTEASKLLEDICRWEIRALLDGGLRFRTACDLRPVRRDIADRDGVPLSGLEELHAEVRTGIERCRALLGAGGPLEVRWTQPRKKQSTSE